jgi:hypothetical protein
MRPGRWIAVAAAAGALLLIVPMMMVMVVLNEPSTHCPPGSDVVLADPAVQVGGLSAAQLEHAATIVDQGQAAGMPSLADLVTGVDRAHVALVLAAIAHAAGSHEHSDLVPGPDGRWRIEPLGSLHPWPTGEATP